jgi:transcriptional/translational regulatory protein YebC/TACO1
MICNKTASPIKSELQLIDFDFEEDVSKLIERLEQDEDVQKVFHNMD